MAAAGRCSAHCAEATRRTTCRLPMGGDAPRTISARPATAVGRRQHRGGGGSRGGWRGRKDNKQMLGVDSAERQPRFRQLVGLCVDIAADPTRCIVRQADEASHDARPMCHLGVLVYFPAELVRKSRFEVRRNVFARRDNVKHKIRTRTIAANP